MGCTVGSAKTWERRRLQLKGSETGPPRGGRYLRAVLRMQHDRGRPRCPSFPRRPHQRDLKSHWWFSRAHLRGPAHCSGIRIPCHDVPTYLECTRFPCHKRSAGGWSSFWFVRAVQEGKTRSATVVKPSDSVSLRTKLNDPCGAVSRLSVELRGGSALCVGPSPSQLFSCSLAVCGVGEAGTGLRAGIRVASRRTRTPDHDAGGDKAGLGVGNAQVLAAGLYAACSLVSSPVSRAQDPWERCRGDLPPRPPNDPAILGAGPPNTVEFQGLRHWR